jgi:hypothetical protein
LFNFSNKVLTSLTCQRLGVRLGTASPFVLKRKIVLVEDPVEGSTASEKDMDFSPDELSFEPLVRCLFISVRFIIIALIA